MTNDELWKSLMLDFELMQNELKEMAKKAAKGAEQAAEWLEQRRRGMRDEREIQQSLGKVLGYPWFEDDQENFPGATEKEGVCVGDQVGTTIAAEAAKRIERLEAMNETLRAENEALATELRMGRERRE